MSYQTEPLDFSIKSTQIEGFSYKRTRSSKRSCSSLKIKSAVNSVNPSLPEFSQNYDKKKNALKDTKAQLKAKTGEKNSETKDNISYETLKKMVKASNPSSPDSSPSGSSIEDNFDSKASRKKRKSVSDEIKYIDFWTKRRKNNEAAKRSRDAKRLQENETAIRLAFLEEENFNLKFEITKMLKILF